jgi:hypothetical protein
MITFVPAMTSSISCLLLKISARIGFAETQILDYLRVEWISEEEHRRLAGTLGIKP